MFGIIKNCREDVQMKTALYYFYKIMQNSIYEQKLQYSFHTGTAYF